MSLPLPTPTHEVWCSLDGCGEHYGWEDLDDVDDGTLKRLSDDEHRYIYTAEQITAYGKACRAAALEEVIELFQEHYTLTTREVVSQIRRLKS